VRKNFGIDVATEARAKSTLIVPEAMRMSAPRRASFAPGLST
jgi:hypothetical protein